MLQMFGRLPDWLRGTRAVSGVPGPAAHTTPSNPVVLRLAEQLRQRRLAAGGWAAEAGGLAPEAFVEEADRLVRAITLGDAQGGPPTP
ncbi:MAG: hypothetical protein IT305_04240 [Chloroflexi bacterium]|nr:hypothetical protein [Chloroflexota bacterium]